MIPVRWKHVFGVAIDANALALVVQLRVDGMLKVMQQAGTLKRVSAARCLTAIKTEAAGFKSQLFLSSAGERFVATINPFAVDLAFLPELHSEPSFGSPRSSLRLLPHPNNARGARDGIHKEDSAGADCVGRNGDNSIVAGHGAATAKA